jgi:hypothetical protein
MMSGSFGEGRCACACIALHERFDCLRWAVVQQGLAWIDLLSCLVLRSSGCGYL